MNSIKAIKWVFSTAGGIPRFQEELGQQTDRHRQLEYCRFSRFSGSNSTHCL